MDRRRGTDDGPANDSGGAIAIDDEHAAHLSRSRAVWDRWSNHYKLSESDFEPMRETAMEYLELESGDRVLDIGCGPGVNFERVRSDVGSDGTLVAVDYSPKMIERARARVADHGWENVEVVRADATTADLGECYDAAIATLSMGVMPGCEKAAANIYRSLAPGGRFVVFDLRPVPSGPLRIVNPLLRRFLYWFANWNAEDDVFVSLETVFDRVDVVETYATGIGYTVLAIKAE